MKKYLLFIAISSTFLLMFVVSFSYSTDIELSWDNGYQAGGIHYDFTDYSLGVDYNLPPGGPWYLKGIKYCINNTWPQQGNGFYIYAMKGPDYEEIIWGPVFNHNQTPYIYCWITQSVDPKINLTEMGISNFMCAINNIYPYPYECESLTVDGTNVGPHDWFCLGIGGTWKAQPNPIYGKQEIRALIDDVGNTGVETTTIGQTRVLYR